MTEPWVASAFEGVLRSASFRMVEIDPLIAYQYTIDTERTARICASLPETPPLETLLTLCLPAESPGENVQMSRQPHAVVLKSRNLNFNLLNSGLVGRHTVGIVFGWSLPLVQAVRFEGNYYLFNGFHRAYGIRAAGGRFMPCLVRDVDDLQNVGIRGDGSTFDGRVLRSDNPPTLGHYTGDRAWEVALRAVTRIIHVTWSEHVMADE